MFSHIKLNRKILFLSTIFFKILLLMGGLSLGGGVSAASLKTSPLTTVFSVWETAKQAIDVKDFKKAEATYQIILNNPTLETFHTSTRLKLAQVYLADSDFSKALQVLQTASGLSVPEQAIVNEQIGDIYYFGQHQIDMARQAYQQAKKNLQDESSEISGGGPHALELERLNLKISVLNI